MAIAHVVSFLRGGVFPGDPVATTLANSTGATFFAVAVGFYPDTGGANLTEVVNVTDNLGVGNTYVRAGTGTQIAGSDEIEIWYCMNATGGAGHVITADLEGSTYASIAAAGYSGLEITGALDQTTGATGSSATTNSGSVTTTTPNQLLIGAGTHTNVGSGENLFTAVGAYNMRSQYSSSASSATCYLEDQIVSSIGTYDAQATSPGSGTWAARIATFKMLGDTPPTVAGPTLWVNRSGIRLS